MAKLKTALFFWVLLLAIAGASLALSSQRRGNRAPRATPRPQTGPARFKKVAKWNATVTVTSDFSDSFSHQGLTMSSVWKNSLTMRGEIRADEDMPSDMAWKGNVPSKVTISERGEMSGERVSVVTTVNGSTSQPGGVSLHIDARGGVYSIGGLGPAVEVKSERVDRSSPQIAGNEERRLTRTFGQFGFKIPLPSSGMSLSGSRTIEAPIPIYVGGKKPKTVVTWSLVPAGTEELELIVTPKRGYDTWLPEGQLSGAEGNTVAFRAELRTRQGRAPRKKAQAIKFQLVGTSSEKGVCLNWPATGGGGKDLRILQARNPSLTPGDAALQSARTTQGNVTAAEVTISSFDYGAYGKLRVTATMPDGQVIVGHLAGAPSIEDVPVPKDENGNRIADHWENLRGVMGQGAEDDEDETATPQAIPGDNITNYEEYRGFRVHPGTTAAATYRRLDPKDKDLFVIDDFDLLDNDLWTRATDIAAHRVTGTQRRVVDVNEGYAAGEKCYAVHLVSRSGMDDHLMIEDTDDPDRLGFAIGAPGHSPQSTEIVVVYPDRINDYFFFTWYETLKRATANPDSEEARRLGRIGLGQEQARQVLAAFDSRPSAVAEAIKLYQKRIVVHELGHACGVNHHSVGDTGQLYPQAMGAQNCPMRYLKWREVADLIVNGGGNTGFGDLRFCADANQCWKQIRLKNR